MDDLDGESIFLIIFYISMFAFIMFLGYKQSEEENNKYNEIKNSIQSINSCEVEK